MRGQDQSARTQPDIEMPQQADIQHRRQPVIEMHEPDEEHGQLRNEKISPVDARAGEFDWLALAVIIVIAALFAGIARLNAQPATSLTPIAVLSATGCGLLITALRKLRTPVGAGLLEAGIAGLVLALFQFLAAISYPNVLSLLSSVADERAGFLTTWLVILLLSIVFSVAGAAVGHLAFAPLRPLPARTDIAQPVDDGVREQELEQMPVVDGEPVPALGTDVEEIVPAIETDVKANENTEQAQDEALAEAESTAPAPLPVEPQRSFLSYAISVLLLGLAPTLTGIVFAAIFDYMLSVNHFLAGPYPTLRLLSALLPWQIAIPFNPGSSTAASLIVLEELWRIPLFLGNPAMFDFQALEPMILNGAALASLLLTLRGQQRDTPGQAISLGWRPYLALELIFGLLLVLPADLFIMRGLQGLLRMPLVALPIRTLFLLNTFTFALNLLSGPIICLALAIVLRLLWHKRAQHKKP
jgi:hypothetical protein